MNGMKKLSVVAILASALSGAGAAEVKFVR